MINKQDLMEALEHDCSPYDPLKVFPRENTYAFLDESGDGAPMWTFNRDRMEEDAYALLNGKKAMTKCEFTNRERMVLHKIEEILDNTVVRCSDKKIVGDIGFWTGMAYRVCADFLWDIKEQMFEEKGT